jgi:PIN domain nuclease of toxin-antitoxin system
MKEITERAPLMNSYVFDSYAVLAMFRKEQGHEIVTALLTKFPPEKVPGTSVQLIFGEVYLHHSAQARCRARTVSTACIDALRCKELPPILIFVWRLPN